MLQKCFFFFTLLLICLLATVRSPGEAESKALADAFEKTFDCDIKPSRQEWLALSRDELATSLPKPLQEKLILGSEAEVIKILINYEEILKPFIRSVCIQPRISKHAYEVETLPPLAKVKNRFFTEQMDAFFGNLSAIQSYLERNSFFSQSHIGEQLKVHYHRRNADYAGWILSSNPSVPTIINNTDLFGATYSVPVKRTNDGDAVKISLSRGTEVDFLGRTLYWKITHADEEIWLVENEPKVFTSKESAEKFIEGHLLSAENYLRISNSYGRLDDIGLHVWKYVKHTNAVVPITDWASPLQPAKYSKGVYFRLPLIKLGYTERLGFMLVRDGEKDLANDVFWDLNKTDQFLITSKSDFVLAPWDKQKFLSEIKQ